MSEAKGYLPWNDLTTTIKCSEKANCYITGRSEKKINVQAFIIIPLRLDHGLLKNKYKFMQNPDCL